ncbi:MAG TPA: hypothetical protein EYP56_10090 [Planctomycetaceae bacterium]|nr:hypothetical protein [Planctomycetaceae bacterium]
MKRPETVRPVGWVGLWLLLVPMAAGCAQPAADALYQAHGACPSGRCARRTVFSECDHGGKPYVIEGCYGYHPTQWRPWPCPVTPSPWVVPAGEGAGQAAEPDQGEPTEPQPSETEQQGPAPLDLPEPPEQMPEMPTLAPPPDVPAPEPMEEPAEGQTEEPTEEAPAPPEAAGEEAPAEEPAEAELKEIDELDMGSTEQPAEPPAEEPAEPPGGAPAELPIPPPGQEPSGSSSEQDAPPAPPPLEPAENPPGNAKLPFGPEKLQPVADLSVNLSAAGASPANDGQEVGVAILWDQPPVLPVLDEPASRRQQGPTTAVQRVTDSGPAESSPAASREAPLPTAPPLGIPVRADRQPVRMPPPLIIAPEPAGMIGPCDLPAVVLTGATIQARHTIAVPAAGALGPDSTDPF